MKRWFINMARFVRRFLVWIARNWIFLAFAALGSVQLFRVYDVEPKAAILIGVSGIPILLPLIARYVKSFAVGNVQTELRQSSVDIPSSDQTSPDIDEYGRLSIHARHILRALWHFQLESFGEDADRRWGFAVGQGAAEFVSFSIGVQELQLQRLVSFDGRGICFLSNEGLEFCARHRDRLENEDLIYQNFAAAE